MVSSPLRVLVAQRLSELGISQAELARRAGLNAQFINDLLKGKKNRIRPEFAFQLALALQVPPLQILRDLGLLFDENKHDRFSDSDQLTGALGAALSIIDTTGKRVEISQVRLPTVRGPFLLKDGAVHCRVKGPQPRHLRLPEWMSKEAHAYCIPSDQLENQNTPILADGELLLVSPGRPISRFRRFVGYVTGERGAVSPWVFSYLGRAGNSYELNLSAGAVRLPVTSLVLAHAIVGVIDREIIPNSNG